MLKAVTFDWGDTLVQDSWNEDVARESNAAGLAALAGRADLPDPEAVAAWWADAPAMTEPRREDELDILAETRRCFSELGVDLGDDEVSAYYAAVHAKWGESVGLSPHTHALLDALRKRGLRLAVISNVATPGRLVRESIERQGIAERVDAVVLSCEVGKRKPHPAIFEHALEQLGVPAEATMHVGDRRYHDVHGAAALGIATVQALWFHADVDSDPPEPDYEAFTMFDVLNVVDRSLAAREGPDGK